MALNPLSPTQARDRAFTLAAKDYLAALAVARQIGDPWYRCQALTYAAQGCPERAQRLALLREALAVAKDLAEPNRQVSVAAWPLSLLAQEDVQDELSACVADLQRVIGQEPSPVRRADALRGMLGALGQGGQKALYLRVLPLFAAACLSPLINGKRNKRGESALAAMLAAIYRFDPQEAERLVLQIQGPVLLARGLDALAQAKAHERPLC